METLLEPLGVDGQLGKRDYSPAAVALIQHLETSVEDVFAEVKRQPFWEVLLSPWTPDARLLRILREVFLSVYMYQRHTTEAGFHMLGRLPKDELRLLRSLLLHKAEEAEHGEWALRDHVLLGGDKHAAENGPPSPSTFAVAAVWWRMATVENPFGYLGAEYLFEYLTALVTAPVIDEFRRRGLPTQGIGFVVEHATEDVKHTNLIRHWVGDCATRYPESIAAMTRCFEYFRQVYPIPVWTEAFQRVCSASAVDTEIEK